MDMYKEKNPLPVVLIALFNENKILLVKRKREPYKGFYGILGGRQTFGKLTKDIVTKEVLEETGFSVLEDTIETRGLYSEILLDNAGNPKDHFIFRVCKAEIDSKVTEDLEKTDIEKFEWFDLPLNNKIKKNIIPTDLIMLEHVLSERKHEFKEFVMQETSNSNKLKLVYLK